MAEISNQETWNREVVAALKDAFIKENPDVTNIRLAKYYEKRKYGAYFFEFTFKTQEKDNFGRTLREMQDNSYVVYERYPTGKIIKYENRRNSRSWAEESYDNIIQRIEYSIQRNQI